MINWIKKHWPLVWKSTLEQSEREWRVLNDTVHEHWDKSVQLFKDRLAMATTERDAAEQAFNESRDKANDLLEEKNTVERMLQETRASRDAAEAKALGFQRRFAELVPRDQRIPPTVVPNRHWVMVTTDPETRVTSVQEHRLQRIAACVDIALGHGVPPEYVAEQLAASIRDAVLKEYQKQSILGT